MKKNLSEKQISKNAGQKLEKLNDGAELMDFIDANIKKELQDAEYIIEVEYEKELQDETAKRSFEQRTKTKEYHYDDLHDVYKTLASDMDEDTRVVKIYYRDFEVNKIFHVGSDEIGCFLEVYVYEDDRRKPIGSSYSPYELILCIEQYRPLIILSEEKINKIVGLGNKWGYDGTKNIEVEQALIVMLQITHFFKFQMDYQRQWYKKYEDRMNREVEQFKAEQGIRDILDEKEWKHKHGALQYHLCIQDLLLQTLYSLNGLYYRINDRHNDYEEVFDMIFVDRPYGKDLEIAMLDSFLLPLYNSTHRTNYKLQRQPEAIK